MTQLVQRLRREAAFRWDLFSLRGLRTRKGEYAKGTPTVAGLFSSPSGLGRGARLLSDGISAAGFDSNRCDLTEIVQPDRSLLSIDLPEEGTSCGPLILHINPPEVPYVLRHLDRTILQKRPLIGYWAWELPEIPKRWTAVASLFDEIWTPSKFVSRAVRSAKIKPVHTIGYHISPEPVDEELRQRWRGKLRLQDTFSVFFAFDPRSSFSRKNPAGNIEAFLKAFPQDESVKFVLKMLDNSNDARLNLERQVPAIKSDHRICLVEEFLDDKSMHALITSCDVVLSLHRSEGYGLMPAEANARGKPAIVTGWSGSSMYTDSPGVFSVDYCLTKVRDEQGVYNNGNAKWADPDIDHAATLLRKLYELSKEQMNELSLASRQWWAKNAGAEATKFRLQKSSFF